MKSYLFLLLILSFGCTPSANQEPDDLINNAKYAWIDHIIDTTMRQNNIPALSVAVVEEGKLVYAKGFGTLKRNSPEKVQANTVYQIGSDTKKFTAIIAKHLRAENKLDFSTSILEYLPQSLPDSTKSKLKAINLELLLSHKAGIPYRAPSNERIDGKAMTVAYTEEHLLNDLNNIKLRFEPGSDFGYSNLGYAICGYICERASGLTYAKLVEQYIAKPLGMNQTSLRLTEHSKQHLAIPYEKDDRDIESVPWTMGKLAPAGGIFSTATDMAKMMIEQMNAYRAFHTSGDMSSPMILTYEDQEEGGHYGLGLGKSVDEDGTRYGHGGDLDGYASGYVFSPAQNKGLILLTSSGGRWFGQMEKTIRKKLF